MAFNPVQIRELRIAGSGISSTDTSISFRKMVLVDTAETPVTMAMFGTIGYITLEPKTDREENISFTGLTQNANGTATITGVTRGLEPDTPYAENSDFKFAHAGGAIAVVSNSSAYYSQFGKLANDEVLTGQWTAPDPLSAQGLVTRDYMLGLINGGTISTNKVIVAGTAGETVAAGNLVYFDETDNEWKKTDADTAATVNLTLLGISQGAGINGGAITGGVLLWGLDENQSGMSQGDLQYASNTAGGISSTTGTTEKIIGIARNATTLYFDPDFYYRLTVNQKGAIAGGSTFGTPSSTNKFITQDYLNSTDVVRFGGNGSDGVLNVTSGTTTLDLGGATIFTKNYSSINISVGATLAFSNPASTGTIIELKSTGAVTIAGTINASGMGGAGGAGSTTSGANASSGQIGYGVLSTEVVNGIGAAASAGVGGVIFTTNKALYTKNANQLSTKSVYVYAGSGGGGGRAGDDPDAADGGNGGNGGGAIVIESRGALNFTGTINTSGLSGTDGATGSSSSAGGGGGGGGSAGSILVLYNTLTANSGTLTSAGGASGAGGAGTSGSISAGQSGGGGGAGSYTSAGGAGSSGAGNSPAGAGAGAGGTGGVANGASLPGAAGGASEGGLVAQNKYFF